MVNSILDTGRIRHVPDINRVALFNGHIGAAGLELYRTPTLKVVVYIGRELYRR
jgi:hypothetical protein